MTGSVRWKQEAYTCQRELFTCKLSPNQDFAQRPVSAICDDEMSGLEARRTEGSGDHSSVTHGGNQCQATASMECTIARHRTHYTYSSLAVSNELRRLDVWMRDFSDAQSIVFFICPNHS